MPQLILPLIPEGATTIGDLVSVWRGEDQWTYFYGTYPVYSHMPEDQRMFRFVIAQMINSGACRQVDIIKTFGIPKTRVARAIRQLRNNGPESFFQKRKRKKGGTKLTPEKLEKAQELLNQDYSRKEAANELGVKPDTLRKAINDGRLKEPTRGQVVISKSSRSVVDTAAAVGLGTACTRTVERTLASFGKCIGATVQFETCLDVPKGGVLCALPALVENGLLSGSERMLGKIKGYYTVFQLLLLLALMALCRIKTVEQLRGYAPGEFGKLLGLDRIPEVRCLRNKMDAMSADKAAERWAAHLCELWMNADPEAAGTLYIDGHVRVYHGRSTHLPRRYVSRERLCLRGVTDYWVNDEIGRPFFVVEKTVDPGLQKTLRQDIVPRLLKDVPNQPSDLELEENPLLCRLTLVFDREGYSPDFFDQMWREYRVACITYHKYPDEPWPEDWFTEHKAVMPGGEEVSIRLCEMGSLVGSGESAIWMREVRKLTDAGHQTSIISTAFELSLTLLAVRMFTRWCQENFFQYMMHHFDIDRIIEYGDMDLPDTEQVVNPAWRELNRQRNSVENKLRYRRASFAEKTIHPETEDNPKKYAKWLEKKSSLLEEIEHYEWQLQELKDNLKKTDKHINWAELEEQDKIHRLLPGRKRLLDTVRMIAYRSETAMIKFLTGPTVDSPSARRLLQDLFVTEADIFPEPSVNRLRIRVHGASRPAANQALVNLFEVLNKAEVVYPGTDLKLVYELTGYTAQDSGAGVIQSSQG
jgi:transposase-like protein